MNLFLDYDGTLSAEPVNQIAHRHGWTDEEGQQFPGWKVETGKIASDVHDAKQLGHMPVRPGTFIQGHRADFTTDAQSADMDDVSPVGPHHVLAAGWRPLVRYSERLTAWEALDAETDPWPADIPVLLQIIARLCEPLRGVCIGNWPRRFRRRCDPGTYLVSLNAGTIGLPDPEQTVWTPSLILEQIPAADVVARYDELMGIWESAYHWYDDTVGASDCVSDV